MAGVTREQRSQSWNVQIWVGTSPGRRVAGIYQRDSLLRVSDLAHELELCLIFDKPDDTLMQPALLRKAAGLTHLIVLDDQDDSPFPTPPPNDIWDYLYILHSSQCTGRELHSLTESCIRRVVVPKRRADPRYQEIGKQSQDDRLAMVPLRRFATLKRRSTSTSTTRTASPSPAKMYDTDEPIPKVIISPEVARPYINDFRSNVLANSGACVISGKGKSWFLGGIVGPGIEAAHIVPQVQWSTYPIHDDGCIADIDKVDELQSAWLSTWDASNGFPMLSHLHKCFDARLFSIHPKTHLIRAFVNYDVITEFHGQVAKLPRNIDQRALQHHWDMCCLENTPTSSLPFPLDVLGNVPEFPSPSIGSAVSQGDPSKDSFQQAPGTQTPDTQQASPSTSHQALGTTARPPSPPLSEPGSEVSMPWCSGSEVMKDSAKARQLVMQELNLESFDDEYSHSQPGGRRKFWRRGREIIKDRDEAERLLGEGWLLEEISNEKCGRGRAPAKKRCVATEEDAEDDGFDSLSI